MSDTSIFEWINGLSGHVRIIDEFFKGFANDYFTLVAGMLLMIWLWFFAHSPEARDRNQRTVVLTMISIGMAATAMILINDYLPAHLCPHLCRRPFDVLPPDRINVVYYRPLDSSFPCNYAAIMFSMAFPVLFRYWKYGIWLLAAWMRGGVCPVLDIRLAHQVRVVAFPLPCPRLTFGAYLCPTATSRCAFSS
jgi:hypothetical protein